MGKVFCQQRVRSVDGCNHWNAAGEIQCVVDVQEGSGLEVNASSTDISDESVGAHFHSEVVTEFFGSQFFHSLIIYEINITYKKLLQEDVG
jgi:hypothetical protein